MKLLVAILFALVGFGSTQEVKLTQGVLRGVQKTSHATGSKFLAFQGIPYAKPPVGELRFKDPEPPEPWPGVRDGEEGELCTQRKSLTDLGTIGGEDCLFLNVYTSELEAGALPRAVMVWIPGGAFITGSGNSDMYGPDYLLDAGVLVVTLNYRLGALGFLSLYDPEVPGNMGLKDQVAALRWVQQNIAAFGGDPNNVTIFGESAGSASVHLLMLSPLAKGLFQRAICQSGMALNPWAFKRSVRDNTKLLAATVGCVDLEPKALAACLREVPAEQLASASVTSYTPEDERAGMPLPFPPTLDPSFLPREPRHILEAGDFQQVPFLAGVNTAEGLPFVKAVLNNQTALDVYNDDFERFVPQDLKLHNGSSESRLVADMIREFYFGSGDITQDNMQQYTDLTTDRLFLIGFRQTLDIQSKFNQQPQFAYQMAYESVLGMAKFMMQSGSIKGVSHMDDLGYLWYTKAYIPALFASPEAQRTRSRMVTMWTNFAKTGDPTPETTELLPVRWRPYSDSDPAYLLIEEELRVDSHIEKSRMNLWDSIYAKYGSV